jgi:carbon storage regulator
MLCLSRKRNEKVIIDNKITVTVLDIQGERVRLGFEGPKEIPIHREEIQKIINDNIIINNINDNQKEATDE